MRKTFYTIWKKDNNSADAILLDNESTYYTKHGAFRRALKLANNLVYGHNDKILVRKIKIGCDTCIEWTFEATA